MDKELKQNWIDWFNNEYSKYLEDETLNDYIPLDIMIDIIIGHYLITEKIEVKKLIEHFSVIIEKLDYIIKKNNNGNKILTDKNLAQ